MNIDRRKFLKFAGAAGCGLLAAKGVSSAVAPAAQAVDGAAEKTEFNAMLIDTTRCIGCRSCEEACNAANRLPEPAEPLAGDAVFERVRDTTPDNWTVLNRYPNPKEPDKPIFARKQCMHCNQPSCASACLCKAMEKTPEGPVVYHEDRCMGCRYCMISCPFDIPKFQYDSATPFIRKCQFCFSRQKAGEQPACAEACPEGATLFGKRRELIETARERIYGNPGRYYPHVYGENEAGGTSMLFLSAVPFGQLGFPTNVGTKPYPELTSGFLFSVPHVDILWPAAMFGFSYLIGGRDGERKEDGHGE